MLSAVLEAARLLIPAATRLSGYSASWLSRRTFEKQLCLRFLQKASEFKVELTPFFELDTERSTGSGKDSLSATRLFVEWLESPHNFFLLLGGPGSGKTTFCKRAFELIRNRSDVERFRHFEACTFYVQCRDIHGKTYAAIDSQMYRAFASFYFHEVGETEKYVSLLRRIKRRPCLFILDGLDEFPSQDREQLCELVSRINALGVDHKVLVTCRDNMFLDDTELVENSLNRQIWAAKAVVHHRSPITAAGGIVHCVS